MKATVSVSVVWENEKCLKALRVLISSMESVAEDFDYRDDVKQAIKAARYLLKRVKVQSDGIVSPPLLVEEE